MKDQLIGKRFPVLDDGHVILIDCMGSDQAIIDAARVSYGKGTKRASEDRDLIRFLMRHHHGTPFEMAEIKLRVRVPMDCWRQWIRHRTANVNEYSTRYSEAIDSQQKTAPDCWRLQSGTNKQGSGGFLVPLDNPEAGSIAHELSREEAEFHAKARKVYEYRIGCGVAREQARKDLPLSTYTEAYWKCDLRNVLHFLGLRMDSHAQWEIRQYADVIGREIVAKLFPATWEAFEDYTLGAATLSRLDIEAVAALAPNAPLPADANVVKATLDRIFANRREREECAAKLVKLGLLTTTV